MTRGIHRLELHGFRSFRKLELALGPVNVLIGPNGAGKSNLLTFLRLLPLLPARSLARFVSTHGGAAAQLHYGPKLTSEIRFRIDFSLDAQRSAYGARLGYAAGDRLVFFEEYAGLYRGDPPAWSNERFEVGQAESRLQDASRGGSREAVAVQEWLSRSAFYHFHDTSLTSTLRSNAPAEDHQMLSADGRNLPAYLLWLKQAEDRSASVAWSRIERLVQEVAPFIKELRPTPVGVLDPRAFDIRKAEPGVSVRLDWLDRADQRFGPHQLSDGTLRAIALITALAQPAKTLPVLVSIDEPELGLHPAAVGVLAALIRSAASHCQVVLATQSPTLLDHFEASEVLVVEREADGSQIRRLDVEQLHAWLAEYRLSELFDMGVLGGRP